VFVQAPKSDGELVDVRKFNIWFTRVEFTWGIMVCDEAHNLRDPRGTAASRSCMALSSRAKILVTATPTRNKIEDIFGLTLQFWRGGGFADFPVHTDIDWVYMAQEFEVVDIPPLNRPRGYQRPRTTHVSQQGLPQWKAPAAISREFDLVPGISQR